MAECPTCEENFSSDRGMKIHHKRKHGESIATGPSTIEIECYLCGDTHEMIEWVADENPRNFCSDECRNEWLSEFRSGDDNPAKRDEVREKISESLTGIERSEEFKQKVSEAMRGREIEWKDKISEPTGSDHPNWKDEATANGPLPPELYGDNWEESRREALERDDYDCRICGDEAQLNVHHIKGVREFDNPDEANRLENLVTLCVSCHAKVHSSEDHRLVIRD